MAFIIIEFFIIYVVAWLLPKRMAKAIRGAGFGALTVAGFALVAFVALGAAMVFMGAMAQYYTGSDNLTAFAILAALLPPFAVWSGWRSGAKLQPMPQDLGGSIAGPHNQAAN